MTEPDVTEPPARRKRQMTDAQRRALERAQEVKRAKREARAQQREADLAELAAKHALRKLEGASSEPDEVDDLPESVREAAEAQQEAFAERYHSPDAAVPPDEGNPHRRELPTMEVEVADMAGERYVPRNLDDLMSHAPIGDGQYYISVDRKAPRVWGGAQCAGSQPSIWRYMTTEEFKREYGGGEYVMILYGPPKRGGIYDPETRRIRPKALTEPVRFTVPLHEYAPMLFDENADDDEEDDKDMRHVQQPWATGRPKSNAEARMFEAQLEHERTQQDRAEAREREQKERENTLQKEAERQGITIAQLLSDQKESELRRIEDAHRREMDLAERRHNEHMETLRAEINKPGETQALGSALKGILEVMKPNGAASDKQVQELIKSHAEEITRLQNQAQAQIKDANERADNRIRDAEQRADKAKEEAERRADQRITDIERRAEERMRETHERAEKRVREVEDAARRVVEDARQQAQARLDDERRNHDRDLAAKADSANMRVETQKASYETRLAAKDEEIARLRAESERFRLEAAKAGDLPGQVEKFAATAKALGWEKDSGGNEAEAPPDWKTMLLGLGAELIKNGPGMIQSAGNTVMQLRGQAPQPSATAPYMQAAQPQRTLPPRLHTREGGVFQAAPPAFGTEDGAAFLGENTHVPPKYPPGFMPSPPAQAQQPLQQPLQQQPAMPDPNTQQPPQQQAAPPQQQQQAQQAAGVGGVPPDQLAQFRGLLEGALAQRKNPADLAAEIRASVGPQMAAAIAASVTPEAVQASLMQMPDGASSPLIRREGQKFLRELHQAMLEPAE
jgi:hypothetical protein